MLFAYQKVLIFSKFVFYSVRKLIWNDKEFLFVSVVWEEPKSFLNAFNQASASLTLNSTIKILDRDEPTLMAIRSRMIEMGQTRFINLARSSPESMISWALYAGNGIVTKVIPAAYSDIANNTVYQLPSITEEVVSGGTHDFLIKTYPWVPPGKVTGEDIEILDARLNDLGLAFNSGDKKPRNLHRLPDRDGTLIGIDSDMYHHISGYDQELDRKLGEAWGQYISEMYPIYKEGRIPVQSDATDFTFHSIHSSHARMMSFAFDNLDSHERNPVFGMVVEPDLNAARENGSLKEIIGEWLPAWLTRDHY